jgi:RecB family exonuclease
VNVITPTPIWIKSFDFLTKPYDLLQESKKSELPTQGIANTTKCLRLATPLAESKWAVMQIREWLDSGVDPRQIAVHASQIEDYWVMLQPLLEAEGVLVFKNCVSKFSQLPVFQSLLAEFRLHIKSIDFVTLQNFLYSETPKIKKRFENFYAEFKNILDFEDVSKDKGLTLMLSQLNFDQKILNTDSFVKLLAAFWDKCRGDEGQLLSVVRSLLIEVPRDFEASLADWVYLLENLAAKIEVKIQLGDINGIRLTNLQSSDPSFQSHHIFLGLTEDQLKVKKGFGFSPLDLQKIAGDLGFYFDHPDQTSDEFSLKFNSAGAEICYFVCAENTVTGEALSPATDWLDQSRQNLETSPKYFHTVWDSKQQEYLNLQSSILADGDNYQLTNHNVREISVSGFERYQECAFNFKAERIFKLKDLPEQDLDTDRMTEGSIMHSVLEELSVIEDTKNVDKIVENIVNEKVPAFIAAPIRHSFKKRALLVASRFLKFQENLRSVASDFQIISREQKFKLQVKSSAGQDFTVIGKTDRIHALDSDKKITVIMDYKSSDQGFNLLKSALDKGQWQMVLYYLGLQQNSVNPTALQYYFYRSGDSKIVFKLKEFVTEALSLNAQAAMSQEDADSFFEKASEKLVQAVDKICRGELPTEPLNVNQCPQCEWNYLCRAQHLN